MIFSWIALVTAALGEDMKGVFAGSCCFNSNGNGQDFPPSIHSGVFTAFQRQSNYLYTKPE